MITPKEINERNQKFWEEKRAEMDKQLSNLAVASYAYETMKKEIAANSTIFQKTYEVILQQAWEASQFFTSYWARKAGSTKKTDGLQSWIIEAVDKRPGISTAELIDLLRKNEKILPIGDIVDGNVEFTNKDGSEGEAPLSGLKDRLSRAKKFIKSLKPDRATT